jgi:hypothetical protein
MKCAYVECSKEFTPRTHNMKYCSDECCRVATNEKLKEAYYEKKARLAGKKRTCKAKGCTSELSRYNEKNICYSCETVGKRKAKEEMMEMMRNVTGKTSKK